MTLNKEYAYLIVKVAVPPDIMEIRTSAKHVKQLGRPCTTNLCCREALIPLSPQRGHINMHRTHQEHRSRSKIATSCWWEKEEPGAVFELPDFLQRVFGKEQHHLDARLGASFHATSLHVAPITRARTLLRHSILHSFRLVCGVTARRSVFALHSGVTK